MFFRSPYTRVYRDTDFPHPSMRQPHIRMQISEQRRHLLLGKPPRKTRHFALAHKDQSPHLGIRSRSATRQFFPAHCAVNIRRRRLQRQVVVLMAMRASHCVKMLPFGLLRRKLRLSPASAQNGSKAEDNRQQALFPPPYTGLPHSAEPLKTCCETRLTTPRHPSHPTPLFFAAPKKMIPFCKSQSKGLPA
jgi:hypothetical protein